jgi:hypothetical protein
MLYRLLAAVLIAALGIMSALAATLSGAELATLRETKVVHGTPEPSDAAVELAQKIGRDANLDGLRAVIQVHQPLLIIRATGSLNLTSAQFLPEPLEAIIVEFYADQDAHRPLIFLIGRMHQDGHPFPRYRSHALFALLFADMKAKRNDSMMYAGRLVATDLQGIEPDLTATLPRIDPAAAAELVSFLGRRRYAPAVPALRALQESTPLARSVNWLLSYVNVALLQIGTPEAVQAVLDRLAWLGRQTDPRATGEIADVFYNLQRMPAETRPDYGTLRPTLPKELAPDAMGAMVGFIVARKDKRGLPDLILAVAQGNEEALKAMLAWGTSEDWRAAKAKMDQAISAGTLKPERVGLLQRRLDAALADPARQVAVSAESERKQGFAEARAPIDQHRAAAGKLRESDPKRYLAELEDSLQRAEKLIAANAGRQEASRYSRDLVNEIQRLAAYARFTVGDSARAVALYERAIPLSDALPSTENLGLLPRIGLADTLRFDLKDSRKSLRIYVDLLQRVSSRTPSSNDDEAAFQRTLGEWLRAEIAFLGEGKRYAGTPDRDMPGAVAILALSGAEALNIDGSQLAAMVTILHARAVSADEKRDFARQLEALSPSQARLLGALDLLPVLGSPERIAGFLRKHDPTGYLTASTFAIWHSYEQEMADQKLPPAMPGMSIVTGSESDRALMRRAEMAVLGRRVVVNVAVDPRLASPESTWKTFVDALRRSDLDAAWKCTTPGIRNKFERNFAAMTLTQLKAMADSSVGFKRSVEFGEFVEAIVVRTNGHAGAVTFVRQGKEWRIFEM